MHYIIIESEPHEYLNPSYPTSLKIFLISIKRFSNFLFKTKISVTLKCFFRSSLRILYDAFWSRSPSLPALARLSPSLPTWFHAPHFFKPSSPVCAAHIFLFVRLPTGAWWSYQGLRTQRTLTLLPLPVTHGSSARGESVRPPPRWVLSNTEI